MEKYYLCFDIGGTKVKYGILNSNGQILNKASYDTPKESLESFMGPMESIIKGSILSHDIKGISLSCPGF
ncbi:ROK family protein, partial [Clostridium cadaveris]